MKQITAPVLLLAAGPDEERAAEVDDRAAGDRTLDVRYLPEVRHTAAIRQVPEQRVTELLGEALDVR